MFINLIKAETDGYISVTENPRMANELFFAGSKELCRCSKYSRRYLTMQRRL